MGQLSTQSAPSGLAGRGEQCVGSPLSPALEETTFPDTEHWFPRSNLQAPERSITEFLGYLHARLPAARQRERMSLLLP